VRAVAIENMERVSGSGGQRQEWPQIRSQLLWGSGARVRKNREKENSLSSIDRKFHTAAELRMFRGFKVYASDPHGVANDGGEWKEDEKEGGEAFFKSRARSGVGE
jgi:hypothetical protein